MKLDSHPYFKESVALATLHGKAAAIAPPFLELLGMHVEEFSVNTDLLGTFSGDIERKGTPKEVVTEKAKLAVAESKYKFGIASEGSIGTDPYIPFVNSDIELMAFVDVEREITLVENLRSMEIIASRSVVRKGDDVQDFLTKVDFPHHKLIVKSLDAPPSFLIKGVDHMATLNKSLAKGFKDFPELVIESDLRAHCSPSRMENIAKLAQRLALRLSNLCPDCSTPGWGVIDVERGLPCSECGEISEDAPKAEILGCCKCSFSERGKELAESIDPSRCDLCNP